MRVQGSIVDWDVVHTDNTDGTLVELFVWYVDEVGLSNTTAFIGLVKVLAGSPQRYGELADLVRKYEEYEFGGTLADREAVD